MPVSNPVKTQESYWYIRMSWESLLKILMARLYSRPIRAKSEGRDKGKGRYF